MEAFTGLIMPWPATFAPQGWLMCDGTELQINQYAALYSLIGNNFGGTPGQTFKVPDLRNRVPMGAPQATATGVQSGTDTLNMTGTASGQLTLTVDNLPSHGHTASFTANSSSVSVAIPVVPTPLGLEVDEPGPGVSLSKSATTSPDPVMLYSSEQPTSNLKPFDITIPAGAGGTVTVNATGAGKPIPVALQMPLQISTVQPSLTMNYIICLNGLYPSRP